MTKQSKVKKSTLISVFGIAVLAITTVIALNGTGVLQKFTADAYVPSPLILKTYSEVKPTSDTAKMATSFVKLTELYPIDPAVALLKKNNKASVTLSNEWGTAQGNVNQTSLVLTVSDGKTFKPGDSNYKFIWIQFRPVKLSVHALNDSHFDYNKPYAEINNGWGDPYGLFLKLSKLDNNIANCNKKYLGRYASQFLKADGTNNYQGFFWTTFEGMSLYYPKKAGTYYVSPPVCFMGFTSFDKRSYENMVDTRYDTNRKASDYSMQTGAYVTVILNHSSPAQYVFERMYFTDNTSASSNFSAKYCVVKGAFDTTHCFKSRSGYSGIEMMKDGRMYKLAAFEQIAYHPTNIPLAQNTADSISGGPYAFQWWTQTLGNGDKYWDYDGINLAGTAVPRAIPQNGTTWKVLSYTNW